MGRPDPGRYGTPGLCIEPLSPNRSLPFQKAKRENHTSYLAPKHAFRVTRAHRRHVLDAYQRDNTAQPGREEKEKESGERWRYL
eukprot:1394219-Amorphochlora_amoeboformis.AAC.2